MSETVEAKDEAKEENSVAVCRMLRTKRSFGTFRGSMYAWQSGRSTTAVYWCLRTMETVGPDDDFTHPHACCEGRVCFESSE